MRRFLIIEAFGSNRGHMVNYVQCLVDLLHRDTGVTLWGSNELCDLIEGSVKKIPVIRHMARRGLILRLGIAFSLFWRQLDPYDSILFSSFEEISLSLMGRRLSRCSVLVTNNLNNGWVKDFLLKRILQRVKKILVHTNYQKRWVVENFAIPEEKILVVPHYSIGYDRRVSNAEFEGREEIVYLGGSRPDKLQKKFIELVSADVDRKYRYGIYGDVSLSQNELRVLTNFGVTVERRYLPRDDYFRILKRSRFVVLFYDKSFSLRVSGIFFDAVSCLTPVIASALPSFSVFFERFGDLGLMVDHDRLGWAKDLLNSDLMEQYDKYVENARRMKKELGHDLLKEIYLSL